MDIDKLLAEAELITDPVEKEKRLNEISRLILGSPARAATQPLVGGTEPPNPLTTPSVENQAILDELKGDIKLTQKARNASRMETFDDAELRRLTQGVSSSVTPTMAAQEAEKRAELDSLSVLESLVNPSAINRKAGQVVAGAAEIPTSTPIGLAGLLGKGMEAATGQYLIEDSQNRPVLTADQLLHTAGAIRDQVRQAVGMGEPRNIGESVAGIVPSLIGIPGVGAPSSTLGNAAELLTPLVIGGGNKRIIANFATAAVADQAMRELVDQAGDDYKTVFDLANLPIKDEAYPETAKTIGIGLAALMGASFLTPATIKMMRVAKANRTPTLTPVNQLDPLGPANLRSLETPSDLLKAQVVDEKATLSGLGRRAGMPAFDKIELMIDNDTQMAAKMRINEAMHTGNLSSTFGNWKVSITPDQLSKSVARLPPIVQEDADKFIKLYNHIDDLTLKITNNPQSRSVARWSNERRQAIASARTISQRSPIVNDLHSKYREITAATRAYLSEGPYSMLSRAQKQILDVDRMNYVPFDVKTINPADSLPTRIGEQMRPRSRVRDDNWFLQNPNPMKDRNLDDQANVFEVLQDYTRRTLQYKMENDVRGAFIDGMRRSQFGGSTVRKPTKKERGLYSDRLVSVYRGGKKERYLSSKLQKDLLGFDPYIAKFPVMHGMKRMFEQGTTGALSLTFAPMTAFRDSLAGWVFLPRNMKAADPLDVVAAVPKQIWAKTQLAMIDMFKSGGQLPFLSPQQNQAIYQQISNGYMNSIYHLANAAGGFDASLMKTNIENARNIMREVSNSAASTASVIPGANFMGRSLAGMAHTFERLFSAIQEAPRFATVEKNIKAGMPVDLAVREARKLTGDTTRSGRVFSADGTRQFDADIRQRPLKAVTPAVGWTVEGARETTPYFNPMVQGLRRMGEAFIEDPVKTNLRAWTAVGLPVLLGMGWNEMLGEDYNKFAFEGRSSRDIAMNMYFGVPGRPPEEGIQIPIPHELMFFNGPWSTGIYGLMRGQDEEDVRKIMMHMAGEALDNSAMVGAPTVLNTAAAAMGKSGLESINPFTWDDTYNIREDNVGVLPQNMENVVRSLWGGISDTVLQSAAAAYDGGPEAFFQEFNNALEKKIPVVKNLTGNTTSVTNFTPMSEIKQDKIRALNEFLEMYEEHYGRGDYLRTKIPSTSSKGLLENDDADEYGIYRLAPHLTPSPTNPIVETYGQLIKNVLDGNEEGLEGMKTRENIMRDQIRILKSYNAGKASAFKEWQRKFATADERYQAELAATEAVEGKPDKAQLAKLKSMNEAAKAARLVRDQKLDLSQRDDVKKLINHLEKERLDIMKKHLNLIDEVEEKVTEDLRAKGLLQPGASFKVEKHLGTLLPSGLVQ